jgi:ankyrin repeat protein
MVLTHDATYFRDSVGKTVAHTAAELNASAALRYIHRLRPESVHDQDKNHRTPLHWAATCGCKQKVHCVVWEGFKLVHAGANAVKELLALGAEATAQDRREACPRDYVQVSPGLGMRAASTDW